MLNAALRQKSLPTPVLMHTAVRWLLKSAYLTRFHYLYNSVIELLSSADGRFAEAVKQLKK